MLTEIMLFLVVLQTISTFVLIYKIFDFEKDYDNEKTQQKKQVEEFTNSITDEAKEWIANNEPELLEDFDISSLGNIEGLNDGIMSILGGRSFFTQLFTQMLTDDNPTVKEFSRFTKLPPAVAKPILTNVMAGIAQVINSIATKKIIGKTTDSIKEGKSSDNGRIPQFKNKKVSSSF